jgi:hypothetical protein
MDAAMEFKEILRFLNDDNLSALKDVFLLNLSEDEVRRFIRGKALDGSLYNAYSARVLVKDPLVFVQAEIESRAVVML